MVHLETQGLLLRDWRATDSAPFAALNADQRVMEFFLRPMTRTESDALMARIQGLIDSQGFGLYAVEERSTGAFIGFTGLSPVSFEANFAPATEIGWRLAHAAWGHGYATEAARAVLRHAFGGLALSALVSFTAARNVRSRRVMEKIGMTHDLDSDFLHPSLPPDHQHARQVLYRIAAHQPNGRIVEPDMGPSWP
jgi:ribosomal-protein-alanine N-acetyltransferase